MSRRRRGVVHWEAAQEKSDCKDCSKSRADSKRGGHRRGRAEGGKAGRAPGHHHQQQQHQSTVPQGLTLRPVNIRGKRAPGMRAPRNTNQFLMHEKYQLMHMRSDSTGGDSGPEVELDMDIDAYLGVLENARGALDCTWSPLGDANLLGFRFFEPPDQEQSLQYYPSEDDVVKSERFMRRDFAAFCSTFDN